MKSRKGQDKQNLFDLIIFDELDPEAESELRRHRSNRKMNVINSINQVLMVINTAGNLKFELLDAEMQAIQNKLDADRTNLSLIHQYELLFYALKSLNYRKEFIDILTSPLSQQKLRDKVTADNQNNKVKREKKLQDLEFLFKDFSSYSRFADLKASELAKIAFLVDNLIVTVKNQVTKFSAKCILNKIHNVLEELSASRKEIAACMKKHIAMNEFNNHRSNDILLPLISQLTDILGFQLIEVELNRDEVIDKSLKLPFKNPIEEDPANELQFTVGEYFKKYCEIEDNTKIMDAEKSNQRVTILKLKTDLLDIPKNVISSVLSPVIDLVAKPFNVISGISDKFNTVFVEPPKQATRNLIDVIMKAKSTDGGLPKLNDGEGETSVAKIASAPELTLEEPEIIAAPSASTPKAQTFFAAPEKNSKKAVPLDTLLREEIRTAIIKLDSEITRCCRSCFAFLYINKIQVKRQKLTALQQVLSAQDREEAIGISKEYLDNADISRGISSRTKKLLCKVTQEKQIKKQF